jgi:hypothetical protein
MEAVLDARELLHHLELRGLALLAMLHSLAAVHLAREHMA